MTDRWERNSILHQKLSTFRSRDNNRNRGGKLSDTGTDFYNTSCHPQGAGVTGECKTGYGASASCDAGVLPHQTGVYCNQGGTARQCWNGDSASRADGECRGGSTATGVCTHVGTSAEPGNFCLSGPYHAHCYSGGYQAPNGSS